MRRSRTNRVREGARKWNQINGEEALNVATALGELTFLCRHSAEDQSMFAKLAGEIADAS